MLTLDEARRLVSTHASPCDAVRMALAEATGLRLATPILADVDHPPADVSAMDGYAARASELDGARALPVAFEVQAGAGPGELAAGTAARIFTGAVLPAGADCVIPQERATRDDGGTVLLPATRAGAHVRTGGEVFRRGETVLGRGAVLDPAAVALAASAGGATVHVHPRPRLALLTSGSELVAAGETPGPAQIRDSNTPMLGALADEAHLPVVEITRAVDTLPSLVGALERALAGADLVVTTGGVSVGDYDLVPAAIAELGGETLLHGVAIRPGKPIFVAHVRRRLLLGLPGNPISALVGWRLFGRPMAESLAGDDRAFQETPFPAMPSEAIENPGPRLLLRPGHIHVVGSVLSVSPLAWMGSHDVHGPARVNALVRLEPGSRCAPGTGSVGCYPLPWRWTEPITGNQRAGTA